MNKLNLIILLSVFIVFVSCGGENNENYNYEYTDEYNEEGYYEEDYSEQDYIEVSYQEKGGVKHLPIKINGMGFFMIFDTGCSTNLISKLEFLSLYKNGLISEQDILGVEKSFIADGSTVENIVVNLKEVIIDDKIVFYNIQASVSENISAPLLLGNEILNKVESYEIDNYEQVIKFKLR